MDVYSDLVNIKANDDRAPVGAVGPPTTIVLLHQRYDARALPTEVIDVRPAQDHTVLRVCVVQVWKNVRNMIHWGCVEQVW